MAVFITMGLTISLYLSSSNGIVHCHELSPYPSLSLPPMSVFIAMGFTIALSLSSSNVSVHCHELSPHPSPFLPPMSVFIAMNCHHIPLPFCPQWQCSLSWPSPSDSSPIPNNRIQPHELPPLSPSLSLSQSQWHYSFARAVLSHLLLPIFNGCMHLHELLISLSPSFSVPNDSIH